MAGYQRWQGSSAAVALRVRPEIIGSRLKGARASAGMTQGAAALALGMARTTLVAIESGKRSISIEELRAFAELYGADEGELISEARPPLDLQVQFRADQRASESEQMLAVTLLNRLAASVVELEEILGNVNPKIDLPLLSINRHESILQQAEDAAVALRQRLGLGLSPVSNIITLMEFELGLRVFERPLPSKISGAAAFDEKYGGFVLINSKHPLSRRRQTAAHEMCHPLLRKIGVVVYLEGEEPEDKDDKFCDAFGRAFLMPAQAIRRKSAELKELSGELTVRHILMMAIYFGVAIEAMTRRLEALHICDKGLFDSLKDKGLGLRHLDQVRAELGAEPEAREMTPRAALLAGAAYDRELLSEQQIAQKLDLDLLSVRRLLAEVSGAGESAT